MKILLAVSRYPWPPRRGDQLRTAQLIDVLGAAHELTVLAPEPPPGSPAPDPGAGCRLVTYRGGTRVGAIRGAAGAVANGLPLQSGLHQRSDLRRRIRELAPAADLGILQLVRLAAHAQDFGRTPLLVDLVDSLSLNFARRAEVDRWWLRLPLRLEATLLSSSERRLLERAAGGMVVCERDRQALVRRGSLAPEAAARLAVMPLAVSLREETPQALEAAHRPTLALTGNLGYFVNDDAVRWFLAQAWPRLHDAAPELRLVVAGDRPSRSLRRRIAGAGAELLESPDDIRSVLAAATVSLAPMRCGSGLPLKVLEAWSAGVPVVASSWAAAGTLAAPGEDLLVADTPGEWVDAVLSLVRDPALRGRLAAKGRARLVAGYSPRVVGRQLLDVVARAAATADARRLG